MAKRKFRFHNGKKGSALTVRITPRAQSNQVVEVLKDFTVKIRLTASESEIETNKALVAYLGEILDTPVNNIEIVAGENGRDKIVSILNIEGEALQSKLLAQIK